MYPTYDIDRRSFHMTVHQMYNKDFDEEVETTCMSDYTRGQQGYKCASSYVDRMKFNL